MTASRLEQKRIDEAKKAKLAADIHTSFGCWTPIRLATREELYGYGYLYRCTCGNEQVMNTCHLRHREKKGGELKGCNKCRYPKKHLTKEHK